MEFSPYPVWFLDHVYEPLQRELLLLLCADPWKVHHGYDNVHYADDLERHPILASLRKSYLCGCVRHSVDEQSVVFVVAAA